MESVMKKSTEGKEDVMDVFNKAGKVGGGGGEQNLRTSKRFNFFKWHLQ